MFPIDIYAGCVAAPRAAATGVTTATCYAYDSDNSSGDTPKNMACTEELYMDFYFSPQRRLSYKVMVRNTGSDELKSVTIRTKINTTVTDKSFTLNPVLQKGETTVLSVNNIPNIAGLNVLMSAVCKANGVIISDPEFVTANYGSYEHGYPRRAVVEEQTSLFAGWAPRGIETMNLLQYRFPDWILISVHDNDPMSVDGYNKELASCFNGSELPRAVINRSAEITLMTDDPDPDEADEDNYYVSLDKEMQAYPSFVSLLFDAGYDVQARTVTVSGSVEMTESGSTPLHLALAITEDGVGPYDQANCYSGQSEHMLGTWQEKTESVSTLFDNVARMYKSFVDTDNPFPAYFESYVEYSFTQSLPIENVSGDLFSIVGFVINSETGEIMNADRLLVSKSGVHEITDTAHTRPYVDNGYVISSDPDLHIFTPAGIEVQNGHLSAGIYFIRLHSGIERIYVK